VVSVAGKHADAPQAVWLFLLEQWCASRHRPLVRLRSGSFYTSPNAPNVRTLNGHIEIPLAKHPSRCTSPNEISIWPFSVRTFGAFGLV